jgi:hypothetical protein
MWLDRVTNPRKVELSSMDSGCTKSYCMAIKVDWATRLAVTLVITCLSNIPGSSWSVLVVLIPRPNNLEQPRTDQGLNELNLVICYANLSVMMVSFLANS